MEKPLLNDVVDVNGCPGVNTGTVVSVNEYARTATVRWNDGGDGEWHWDRLYLISRPDSRTKASEPKLELSYGEVQTLLVKLQKHYPCCGPVSKRMREFVEQHKKRERAKQLRAQIEQAQKELADLEAQV